MFFLISVWLIWSTVFSPYSTDSIRLIFFLRTTIGENVISRLNICIKLYLDGSATQEEAAEAYDIAAIKFRGVSCVTNFEMTKYDVEKIMASDTLLSGEQARRSNDIEEPGLTKAIVEYVFPSSVAPSQEHFFQTASHDNRSSLDWKVMLNQFPHQQWQKQEQKHCKNSF